MMRARSSTNSSVVSGKSFGTASDCPKPRWSMRTNCTHSPARALNLSNAAGAAGPPVAASGGATVADGSSTEEDEATLVQRFVAAKAAR